MCNGPDEFYNLYVFGRVKHLMLTTFLLVCGAMTMSWICDTISESGFGTVLTSWFAFCCLVAFFHGFSLFMTFFINEEEFLWLETKLSRKFWIFLDHHIKPCVLLRFFVVLTVVVSYNWKSYIYMVTPCLWYSAASTRVEQKSLEAISET